MPNPSASPTLRCRDCPVKSCAAAILNAEELDGLSENSREAEFSKGEILVHEGSFNSSIIYLKSGLVKEFTKGSNSKEQIIQIIKKHSYLGLPSLFGDRINRYSYAALTDCNVCYIDIAKFNGLVKQNGEFAYEILVSVSKDNLHNFQRFVNQSQKKNYGRVADAILYFSRNIFESSVFDLPFTRREFADFVGVSRESVTRVLTGFRQEGILGIAGRKIFIQKEEVLERISRNG